MSFVVGQCEEAAVRREVKAAGAVDELPVGHWEVGEDAETGQVDLRGQKRVRTRRTRMNWILLA